MHKPRNDGGAQGGESLETPGREGGSSWVRLQVRQKVVCTYARIRDSKGSRV